jgi:hypothetical protein
MARHPRYMPDREGKSGTGRLADRDEASGFAHGAIVMVRFQRSARALLGEPARRYTIGERLQPLNPDIDGSPISTINTLREIAAANFAMMMANRFAILLELMRSLTIHPGMGAQHIEYPFHQKTPGQL